MATGSPSSSAIFLMLRIISPWLSCVPWEKFKRATRMPFEINFWMTFYIFTGRSNGADNLCFWQRDSQNSSPVVANFHQNYRPVIDHG